MKRLPLPLSRRTPVTVIPTVPVSVSPLIAVVSVPVSVSPPPVPVAIPPVPVSVPVPIPVSAALVRPLPLPLGLSLPLPLATAGPVEIVLDCLWLTASAPEKQQLGKGNESAGFDEVNMAEGRLVREISPLLSSLSLSTFSVSPTSACSSSLPTCSHALHCPCPLLTSQSAVLSFGQCHLQKQRYLHSHFPSSEPFL